MTPEELQSQTRDVLDRALNQLQTATLLVSQLETQIEETAIAVQAVSQLVETYTQQEE